MLTLAGIDFQNGSRLVLRLASPTAFDRLRILDDITLTGAIDLVFELGFDPLDKIDTFPILFTDSTDSIGGAGHFVYQGMTLDTGSRFFVGTQEFEFRYAGDDGNDVVLYAVPEPTTMSLLVAMSAFFGRGRQRRAGAGRKGSG